MNSIPSLNWLLTTIPGTCRMTGKRYPDIVTCNKKGTFVFLNRPDTVSQQAWQAAKPKPIK